MAGSWIGKVEIEAGTYCNAPFYPAEEQNWYGGDHWGRGNPIQGTLLDWYPRIDAHAVLGSTKKLQNSNGSSATTYSATIFSGTKVDETVQVGSDWACDAGAVDGLRTYALNATARCRAWFTVTGTKLIPDPAEMIMKLYRRTVGASYSEIYSKTWAITQTATTYTQDFNLGDIRFLPGEYYVLRYYWHAAASAA